MQGLPRQKFLFCVILVCSFVPSFFPPVADRTPPARRLLRRGVLPPLRWGARCHRGARCHPPPTGVPATGVPQAELDGRLPRIPIHLIPPPKFSWILSERPTTSLSVTHFVAALVCSHSTNRTPTPSPRIRLSQLRSTLRPVVRNAPVQFHSLQAR